MATTSICGPVAAALADSPARARLLAREVAGDTTRPLDERMLQELYALAGSDGSRRQRQRRQRRRAARHAGLRLSYGLRIDPGEHAPPDPLHPQGPIEAIPTTVTWLGDLDSNQDCSVQSREFYR